MSVVCAAAQIRQAGMHNPQPGFPSCDRQHTVEHSIIHLYVWHPLNKGWGLQCSYDTQIAAATGQPHVALMTHAQCKDHSRAPTQNMPSRTQNQAGVAFTTG